MFKKFLIYFLIIFLGCFAYTDAYGAKSSKMKSLPVEYNTDDGMIIKGNLFIPKSKEKTPVVILLHSLGGTQKNWEKFPYTLASKGYAVLTLDLRGHGQSIYNRKMQRRYWQNFNADIFRKYPKDIILGIDNLKNYKQLDLSRVAIIGSGIGANTAAMAAPMRKYQIKTIVMISPTEKFYGDSILLKLVDYGDRPVFAIAGENDRLSVAAVDKISKIAQGEYKEIVYPRGGSGILLYKSKPEIKTEILNWLDGRL